MSDPARRVVPLLIALIAVLAFQACVPADGHAHHAAGGVAERGTGSRLGVAPGLRGSHENRASKSGFPSPKMPSVSPSEASFSREAMSTSVGQAGSVRFFSTSPSILV